MVKNLTSENFRSETKTGVVLVDFWALWCGPCRIQEPIIEELASEFESKVTIAKLNIDEHPQTAQEYGIMSIPTIVLFKDGQPVEQMIGVQTKDALTKKLQGLL